MVVGLVVVDVAVVVHVVVHVHGMLLMELLRRLELRWRVVGRGHAWHIIHGVGRRRRVVVVRYWDVVRIWLSCWYSCGCRTFLASHYIYLFC